MTGERKTLSARTLWLSFGIIVSLLIANAVISVAISGRAKQRVDEIAGNALESVRLLGRMGVDIERQQRLVEAHILGATSVERSPIEHELEVLRADYAAAKRDYEPLATFPGEAEAWHQLEADVDRIEEPIHRAMMLSNANRDDEARNVLQTLAPQLDRVERDITASVEINTKSAREARRDVQSALVTSLWYRVGVWLFGIVMTVIVGMSTMRLLVRAERAQLAAYELLEEHSRELDAFAGRVAHDLRGPLSVIATTAQLSERSSGYEKASAGIRRGVSRMNAIIEDLLQLSRIQGATITDVCDPKSVMDDVHEKLAESVATLNGMLSVEIATARVRCRDGLFRQIVSNLTENAVKYRRADVAPQVRISGRVVGGDYELRVSDNGIGMTATEATQAFNPLFRAQRIPGVPGTGLGLSIVKRIVEASGGRTRVDSKLGEGTTFVIWLPVDGARA
ncbi:MAG TPA: ATP-binding protein [Polyangia bacterium]|jgi:signal transduction histidine kinase|nr:ATP-binding protein [Polyangia bacterium]